MHTTTPLGTLKRREVRSDSLWGVTEHGANGPAWCSCSVGMLPPLDGVDRETAHRTVLKVWRTWDWQKCWVWDFPWMAMAAARVGEPRVAIEALLKDAGTRNFYDPRGVNTGGPCPYLPGNGGLLFAVAMMAAGWDGAPERHAPGFPADGTWTVKWEGLKPAP